MADLISVLIYDVSDHTRVDHRKLEVKLEIGETVSAFGREDAIVQAVRPICPADFDQAVEVLVLDDSII